MSCVDKSDGIMIFICYNFFLFAILSSAIIHNLLGMRHGHLFFSLSFPCQIIDDYYYNNFYSITKKADYIFLHHDHAHDEAHRMQLLQNQRPGKKNSV